MDYEDNRLKNFEYLREHRDEYGYPEKLLRDLQGGLFNCLNEIKIEDRNNKAYMEPLLFAVKNSERGTYEVFKYYGEDLQRREMEMAIEIAGNEPKVLEDTPFTEDSTLVLKIAEIEPEIILYISEDLRSDGEFIEELCKRGNKEAIEYAIDKGNVGTVIQDNPNLLQNHEFMKEAIKEDATLLALASPDLKDNYEFIKEASKENREVIDYVAEHTDEFGKDALNAAKDSLEENLLTETKKAVEDGRAKLETEKDKLTPEQIDRKERDLNSINKWIKRFEEAETPEKKGRIAHLILVTTGMEQYQNMDQYSNGVAHEKMDPEFRKELEKYEKIYLAAKEKVKEEKAKENKFKPENIEKVAEEATLSGVQGETIAIREEMTADKEQAKESNEIGEK